MLFSCADKSNIDQPTELLPLNSHYAFTVNWLASTGKGVGSQYLFLRPLVLKKNIITTSRNGVINVINLHTGESTKKIDLHVTISAGLGGNEKTWLVATRGAYVIAIDAKTEKEIWRTRVSSEVLATPVIYQGAVLVRTIDGKIISLDLSNGKLRWQYEHVLPNLTLRGNGALVIFRGHIIAGLASGRILALSPRTGAVLWNVALAVPKGSSEIQRLVDVDGHAELYGRILYAASYQGRMAAIDVERGKFLWARNFSTHTGVTVDSEVIYSTDDNGFIWAMNRFSGATLWKQTKLAHRRVTRPVIIGNYLAVGDYQGYIHLLSRIDGHLVARFQIGQYDQKGWQLASGIIVPPVVISKNKLLIISRGGMAYLLQFHQKNKN